MGDRLGRKTAMGLSMIGVTIFGIILSFVQSWQTFLVIWILLHICMQVGHVSAHVYAVEILGPNRRQLAIIRKLISSLDVKSL